MYQPDLAVALGQTMQHRQKRRQPDPARQQQNRARAVFVQKEGAARSRDLDLGALSQMIMQPDRPDAVGPAVQPRLALDRNPVAIRSINRIRQRIGTQHRAFRAGNAHGQILPRPRGPKRTAVRRHQMERGDNAAFRVLAHHPEPPECLCHGSGLHLGVDGLLFGNHRLKLAPETQLTCIN
jgi:hypothetical protein